MVVLGPDGVKLRTLIMMCHHHVHVWVCQLALAGISYKDRDYASCSLNFSFYWLFLELHNSLLKLKLLGSASVRLIFNSPRPVRSLCPIHSYR